MCTCWLSCHVLLRTAAVTCARAARAGLHMLNFITLNKNGARPLLLVLLLLLLQGIILQHTGRMQMIRMFGTRQFLWTKLCIVPRLRSVEMRARASYWMPSPELNCFTELRARTSYLNAFSFSRR